MAGNPEPFRVRVDERGFAGIAATNDLIDHKAHITDPETKIAQRHAGLHAFFNIARCSIFPQSLITARVLHRDHHKTVAGPVFGPMISTLAVTAQTM